MQILEIHLNNYASVRIVPVFMFGVPLVEILSLFAIIKFHSQLPLPGFLILTEGFFTALTSTMVFETVASLLNTRSIEMLSVWRRLGFKNKVQRKKIRSQRPLKIRYGSNYIDQGTSLVSQDFCINQTVSLLLM